MMGWDEVVMPFRDVSPVIPGLAMLVVLRESDALAVVSQKELDAPGGH